MFSKINSMGIRGINPYIVNVEVDVSNGLPGFEIVGLPDAATRESRDRVRSAIKNNNGIMPPGRIVVNLSPAHLKKTGSVYDLAIYVGLLKSTGGITVNTDKCVFLGELSLDGGIQPVNGILPMTIGAKEAGFKEVFVPAKNSEEASVITGIDVIPVDNVQQLTSHLNGFAVVKPVEYISCPEDPLTQTLDFSDIKGQSQAKRAMEIAAAGGHNILLVGSPGSGKSMLAKRLVTILPEMTFEESIESTKIHSIAGILDKSLIKQRPFRSPHHTISTAGLSGGGSYPTPGEVSLAHNGVLFLDELPEFKKSSLEVLRQPLEDSSVNISRVNGTISYPCSIMLVAAMNPCPCGHYGNPLKDCRCPNSAITKYLGRVSGPLLDRLDIHVEVNPVDYQSISGDIKSESSEIIRARVNRVRQLQNIRFEKTGITCNAKITPPYMRKFCVLSDDAAALMKSAFERLGLSARAYDKILKIARTIADLEDDEKIEKNHITEAIQYRNLDRKYWNRG